MSEITVVKYPMFSATIKVMLLAFLSLWQN